MATGTSHARNRDRFLDRNGENEVSASELKDFIDVEGEPTIDSSVGLLLSFDEGSGNITDDKSLNNHNVTFNFNGPSMISSAQSKFGPSSVLFDGSGENLVIPDSSVWDLGSPNTKTISFWVRHNALNKNQGYFLQQQTVTDFWSLTIGADNSLGYIVQTSGTFTGILISVPNVITDTNWHHIALTTEPNVNIYVDGNLLSYTQTIRDIRDKTGPLVIGKHIDGSAVLHFLDGYMDDVLFSSNDIFGTGAGGPAPSTITVPKKSFFPFVDITNKIVSSDGVQIFETNNTAQELLDTVSQTHIQNSDIKLDEGQANEVTSVELRNFIDSKSQNSGLASLDAGGKVPTSELPDSVVGALTFQGTWNATTNTPTLGDSGVGGVQGDYFVVNVAGTTSIDGNADWEIGDWVVHNGSTWDKIDNSDKVSSVNGATGVVTLDSDDITEAANLYYTEGRVSANTDVVANTAARHDFLTLGGVASDTTDDTLDLTGQVLTVNLATTSTDGAMSASDKTKLDAITGTNTGDEVSATESVEGLAELATQVETDTGTDDSRIVTPLKLANSSLAIDVSNNTAKISYTDAAAVSANTAKISADGSIDTHSDVDTTTAIPSVGDHLEWDGSNWIPAPAGGGGSIFGTQFNSVEDLTEQAETSTTYIESLKLTTPSLPAGDYFIQWSASIATDKTSLFVKHKIELDDTTILYEIQSQYTSIAPDFYPISGCAVVTLTAAIHDIDIDMLTESGAGAGVRMKNTRLAIWRIS